MSVKNRVAVALISIAAMAPTFNVQAQGPTATVQVTDYRINKTFNQRVRCNDYMVLNGQLYTTNKVASAIDIGGDVRLDTWEPTDIDSLEKLRELSSSVYGLVMRQARDYQAQGHTLSEEQMIMIGKAHISAAIQQRTVLHMGQPNTHNIPAAESKQALNSARAQCARKLGL